MKVSLSLNPNFVLDMILGIDFSRLEHNPIHRANEEVGGIRENA